MFRDIFASDTNDLLVGLLALAVICGAFAENIGERKGRAVQGLILGLTLGPIGILIAAELRPAGDLRTAARVERSHRIAPSVLPTPPAPPTPPHFDPSSMAIREDVTV